MRAIATTFTSPARLPAAALLLAALLAPALLGPAAAHEFKAGDLRIGHPWARATPPGAPVAGAYLTVTNAGAAPDRLLSASVEAAGAVELHEMATANGLMTMRALPAGIPVPPGAEVALRPGGLHLMLVGLKGPLAEGAMVRGTLVFERAGAVPVEFEVEGIGARGPAHGAARGATDNADHGAHAGHGAAPAPKP